MAVSRTQLRLTQVTGSFNDREGGIVDNLAADSAAAIADVTIHSASFVGLMSEAVSAIKRIHGHTTFARNAAGTFYTNILPSSAGGIDIGSTSAEFGDVFIADDKKIQFGNGQDFTIEYDEDGDDVAQFAGSNIRIGHGAATQLQFRDSAIFVNSSADGVLDIEADTTINIGNDNSGVAISIGHSTSEVTVNDNLTVTGDLTVNGDTVTVNTTNLTVDDPIIVMAHSSSVANTNGGIAIMSGSNTAHNAMVFGRVANDTWGVGIKDIEDGDITHMTDMTLASLRAGKIEIDGANDSIDVATDMVFTAAADITLAPGGANVKPNADSSVDLGVSGTAFRTLFVDDIDLNGQGSITIGGTGRIDLDADDDTSIRASADDVIMFEIGGVDEIRMAENLLSPETSDGAALGSGTKMWSDLFLASGGVVNFNNGNVTLTHSANLLTVNKETRVAKLSIDSANDFIDVSTDLIISASADIKLGTQGGEVRLVNKEVDYAHFLNNTSQNFSVFSSSAGNNIALMSNAQKVLLGNGDGSRSLTVDLTAANEAKINVFGGVSDFQALVLDGADATRTHILSGAALQLKGNSEKLALRFFEQDETHYVGLVAPNSIASNVTFVLPNADGASGQFLKTNGAGQLSFGSATSENIKRQALIKAALTSGSALDFNSATVENTAPSSRAALNLSGISSQDVEKLVDVYVNGQLLVSGSDTHVGTGLADYSFQPHSNASQIKFGFDLEVDDTVIVTVR